MAPDQMQSSPMSQAQQTQQAASEPQPLPAQPEGEATAKVPGKFPVLPVIGAVIAILVVIGAYFALSGSSGSGGSSKLLDELSSPQNQTAVNVMVIAANGIISSTQFNVSYNGVAKAHLNTSSLLGDISATVPIKLGFEKYANNTRLSLNASDIPLLGNLSIVQISLENGTSYSCSASNGGILGSLEGSSSNASVSKGMTCQVGQNSNVSQFTSDLGDLSSSGINNATVKVLGNREYNGQGCVLVHIYGNMNQSDNTTVSYSLFTCLSDKYNVPLNVTLAANEVQNSSDTFTLNMTMHETSIGNPVTLAGLATLPGPLNASNSQGSGESGLGTSCIAVAGYLCEDPSMNAAGQLSFTFGQSIGITQYNVGLACAAQSTAGGEPYSASSGAFYYPTSSSGASLSSTLPAQGSAITLYSGQTESIADLPCFGSTGSLLGTAGAGSEFTGYIWYNYTDNDTAPGASNPWLTSKIATVSVSRPYGNTGGAATTAPYYTTRPTTTVAPSTNTTAGIDTPLNSSELEVINNASDIYFEDAGNMFLNGTLQDEVYDNVVNATPYVAGGKPSVIYLCSITAIYCGENKWAMALALGRFGSFSQLYNGYSSFGDDDVPTLYWTENNYTATDTTGIDKNGIAIGNSYMSKYINFFSIEGNGQITGDFFIQPFSVISEEVNATGNKTYIGAFNYLISLQNSNVTRFSGVPYTVWGANVVTGADAVVFGNTTPTSSTLPLTYMTHAQVLAQLKSPSDQFAWSEYAAADIYIAHMCGAINNAAPVCSLSAIQSIEALT